MKNLTKFVIALMLSSNTLFYASGQTLKERIDQAKEVKVYFKNADIISRSNTTTQQGNTMSGSGCENFTETTPLSSEYVEAVQQITDLLNKGFNTTVFVAGDFSDIYNLPLASTGELNWLRLGKSLAVYVSTSGGYFTIRQSGSFVRDNSLEVQSYLNIYSVTDGKLRNLVSKMLASVKTPDLKSDKCEDYAYFVKNFPAVILAEPFRKEIFENTSELIEKEMEKYEKAMKKKKS